MKATSSLSCAYRLPAFFTPLLFALLSPFALAEGTGSGNQPPKFVSQPKTEASIPGNYRYQLQAVDADGDGLQYLLDQGPDGMALSGDVLSWVPQAAGARSVHVRVIDGRGGEDYQHFLLSARPAQAEVGDEACREASPLSPLPFPTFAEQNAFVGELNGAPRSPVDQSLVLASMVTGQVRDSSGKPIPGVSVQVKDLPELGIALTTAQGQFSLWLAAGSAHILVFEKSGYPIRELQVAPESGDYFALPPLVLGGLEPNSLPPPSMAELPTDAPPQRASAAAAAVSYTLDVPGTQLKLHYDGKRAPAFGLARTLDVPVTEDKLPDDLQNVQVELSVAGKRHAYTFPAEASQRIRLSWDGEDVFGRKPEGERLAEVVVRHEYGGEPLSRTWDIPLGNYRNQYTGLGGWGLNVHHAWQADAHKLYLGDGRELDYGRELPSEGRDWNLTLIRDLSGLPLADKGFSLSFDAQGSLRVASGSALWRIEEGQEPELLLDLTQASAKNQAQPPKDGAISQVVNLKGEDYALVDVRGNRLYLMEDGVLRLAAHSVATSCGSGYFCNPKALAYTRAGELMVAAAGSRRVYRLGAGDVLTSWAGNGTQGRFDTANGDGGPASAAAFGELGAMSPRRDGGIYVADNYAEGYRVRVIDTWGKISTLLQTQGVQALALLETREGRLLVSQGDGSLRVLEPDGEVSLHGLGHAGGQPSVPVVSLAWHPAGTLYLGGSSGLAHRLDDARVQQVGEQVSVLAEGQWHWFDRHGRHLRSTDAKGQALHSFAYDEFGLLASVTNASGQKTDIDRANGQELALKQGGQPRLRLALNEAGQLRQAIQPDGSTHRFQYGTQGEMTAVTAPDGSAQSYHYNPQGKLLDAPYVALPSSTLDTPPDAGDSSLVATIPGEFSVTPTGAASYVIPIEVPPGRAGVAPKLSLQYNSQAPNGALGQGWSLSGLSNIHRCVRNLAQDSAPAPVSLIPDDALCMDGRRLRRVSGLQGLAGSEYRLEIDDMTKVELLSNGNWLYFRAWAKSGEVMEYGRTADSLVGGGSNYYFDPSSGPAVRWALNRVTDSSGNTIDFTYENISYMTGQHRLSRVDYAGHVNGAAPFASVRLAYEARPDPSYGYLSGKVFHDNKRLSALDTYLGDERVRSYRFDYYEADLVDPQSRLAQVRMCVGPMSAPPQCVAPTLVEWYESPEDKYDAGFGPAIRGPQALVDNGWLRDRAQVLDFDGDGVSDLAYAGVDGHLYVEPGWYLGWSWGRIDTGVVLFDPADPFRQLTLWSHNLFLVVDQDGDGTADILVPKAHIEGDLANLDWGITLESWELVRHDRATGGASVTPTQVAGTAGMPGCHVPGGPTWRQCAPLVLDADGDGLQDILFPYVVQQPGLPGQEPETTIAWNLLLNQLASPGQFTKVETGFTGDWVFQVIDMNGDGRQDLFAEGEGIYLSTGGGFQWAGVTGTFPRDPVRSFVIDLNGDGYQDLVWLDAGTVRYRLNQGGASGSPYSVGFIDAVYSSPVVDAGGNTVTLEDFYDSQAVYPMDYNSDGQTDILLTHHNGARRNWWVLLGRRGVAGVSFIGIDTGIDATDHYERHPQAGDFNGDGWEDLVYAKEGYWTLHLRDRERGSLVRWITTGRGRAEDPVAILYQPMTLIHERGSSNTGPSLRDFQAPLPLVSQVSHMNPEGGWNRHDYDYRGARLDALGRGFQGFSAQKVHDVARGLTELSTFAQDFPYTGSLLSRETRSFFHETCRGSCHEGVGENGEKLLGLTQVSYNSDRWTPAGDEVIEAPYARTTTNTTYDLASGAQLSTTLEEVLERDGHQNVTHQRRQVLDALTGELTGTDTRATYDDDEAHWILGRLITSQATHWLGGPENSTGAITRNSAFEYQMEPANGGRPTGLLEWEKVEPNDPNLEVGKRHAYDGYGNRTLTTTHPANMEQRTSASAYDAEGRFPEATTNALGHVDGYTYDPRVGKPLSHTDPNGLTATWQYDALGRLARETQPGGKVVTVLRSWTTDGCPAGSVTREDTRPNDSPWGWRCLDARGLELLKAVQLKGGNYSLVRTEYDALSRPARVSRPYLEGEEPQYWRETTYDDISRPTLVDSPVSGVTTYDYGILEQPPEEGGRKGSYVEVTDALGNASLKLADARGQLMASQDALGHWTDFAYDAVGNRTSITDSQGNRTEVTYNLRGERTQLIDPDMGQWDYGLDALGQQSWVWDGNGDFIDSQYDLLGRRTERWLRGGPGQEEATRAATLERWEYDRPGHGPAIGKLTGEYSPGFSRQPHYDAQGRKDGQATTIGGQGYAESWAYDAQGRVKWHDPAGGDGVRMHYGYDHGYLEHLNMNAYEVWKGGQMDADGNYADEEATWGLPTTLGRDPASGRLLSIHSERPSGQGVVQDLSYEWDEVGNLVRRTDHLGGLAETFTYDGLNRLSSSEVAVGGTGHGQGNYAYDELGNLVEKDGVVQLYQGPGPHQVTQAGGAAYGYDGNGNQVQAGGTAYGWTHLNQLALVQVVDNGGRTRFRHGPDGQRHTQEKYAGGNASVPLVCELQGGEIQNATVPAGQALDCASGEAMATGPGGLVVEAGGVACLRAPQVRLGPGTAVVGALRAGTTGEPCVRPPYQAIRYVGALEHVIDLASGTSERRYLAYANGRLRAVRTFGDGEPAKTDLMLHDHLGSVDKVIIQHAPGLPLAESPSFDAWGARRDSSDWQGGPYPAIQEPRGYTGHEMLDDVGLIHMNGRVYDPATGRFLSADPYVQFPDDGVGYDRYAYVRNNPLTHTDPSGHFVHMLVLWGVSYAADAAAASMVTSLGGAALSKTAALTIEAAVHAGIKGVALGLASKASGGTFADGMQAGLMAGAFHFIGGSEAFGPAKGPGSDPFGLGEGVTVQRVIAHGVVGGSYARAQGEGFGPGFAAGVFGKMAAGTITGYVGNAVGGAAASALIGGTASVIGGGKFANGAVSSAFGYLYNRCSVGGCSRDDPRESPNWWRARQLSHGSEGRVADVYVDVDSLDFGGLTDDGWNEIGQKKFTFPKDSNLHDFAVHGTVTIQKNGDGGFSVGSNIYNNNIQWEEGFTQRNALTVANKLLHCCIMKPYTFHFIGTRSFDDLGRK